MHHDTSAGIDQIYLGLLSVMHELPFEHLQASCRDEKSCATAGQFGASTVLQPMLQHCNAFNEPVLEAVDARSTFDGRSTFAAGGGFVAHPPRSTKTIHRNTAGVFIAELLMLIEMLRGRFVKRMSMVSRAGNSRRP